MSTTPIPFPPPVPVSGGEQQAPQFPLPAPVVPASPQAPTPASPMQYRYGPPQLPPPAPSAVPTTAPQFVPPAPVTVPASPGTARQFIPPPYLPQQPSTAATGSPGCLPSVSQITALPSLAPVPVPSGAGAQATMPATSRLVPAAQFIAVSTANRSASWKWDGILPETGIVMVCGEPFHGKTILAVILAVAMALSRAVLGRAVAQARAIYAKLEHQDRDFADLLRKAAAGLGVHDFSHLFVRRELHLDDDDDVEALIDEADEVGAGVIIIDSLRRAHSGDENSSKDSAGLIRSLHRLAENRLVIVLHHLAKGSKGIKGGATPRGSGDLLAGVDTFVTVKKVSETGMRIEVAHHSAPEVELHLRMESQDGIIRLVPTASSGARQSHARQAIIDVVKDQGPISKTKLRDSVREKMQTKIGNSLIDDEVKALEDEGIIINGGSGHSHSWVLADDLDEEEIEHSPP